MDGKSVDLLRFRLPRGRHGLPREVVVESQRQRLLIAVIAAVVGKGYQPATVADVLAEAGVGRESFYEHFDDKFDCALAAHNALLDDLEERVRAAYEGSEPWPGRVRSALIATLEWFAAKPDAARFMVVEMGSVGSPFKPLFEAGFLRFVRLFDEGLPDDGPASEVPRATEMAVAAVLARVHEETVLGRAERLRDLLPELIYAVLVPFVGEEAALAERARAGSST